MFSYLFFCFSRQRWEVAFTSTVPVSSTIYSSVSHSFLLQLESMIFSFTVSSDCVEEGDRFFFFFKCDMCPATSHSFPSVPQISTYKSNLLQRQQQLSG